jgi:large subunit ribosomal protein L25
MANEISLEVKPRGTGKSIVRELRVNEITPGVIYGRNFKNVNLTLEAKYLAKYAKLLKQNPIFVLKSTDKSLDGVMALIKTITTHPVNRKPVHVDFVAINKDEKITVEVEVVLLGVPKGVKVDGGNLSVITHKVEVECLPNKIPSKLELDITNLGLNEAVHASDLKMPEGVELITAGEITLANIHLVKEEEVVAVVAAPEAAAAPAATGGATAPGQAPAAAAKPAAPAKDKK